MKGAALLLLFGPLIAPLLAAAQSPPAPALTDAQVQTAIDRGAAHETDAIGLHLDESTKIDVYTGCIDCDNIEYIATLYTTVQWIELKAAIAHANHRPFTPADVPATLRTPVLHVNVTVIHYVGSQTRKMPPLQLQLASRHHTAILQPLLSSSGQTAAYYNGSGPPLAYISKAEAVFDLAKSKRLLNKGKFFIVINTGEQKRHLAVKAKDLRRTF
jgi:hypothetical protein